jgi:hypothetical protein
MSKEQAEQILKTFIDEIKLTRKEYELLKMAIDVLKNNNTVNKVG